MNQSFSYLSCVHLEEMLDNISFHLLLKIHTMEEETLNFRLVGDCVVTHD